MKKKSNSIEECCYFIEKQEYYERMKYTIIIPFKPITMVDAFVSTEFCCCK